MYIWVEFASDYRWILVIEHRYGDCDVIILLIRNKKLSLESSNNRGLEALDKILLKNLNII